MLEICKDIFAIYGRSSGCNCYLLEGKENALIDSGSSLNGNFFSKLPSFPEISLIINTHPHIDHFAGNDFFPSAKVAMHGKGAEFLQNQDREKTCCEYFDSMPFPKHKVDLKLKDGDEINTGSSVLHVIYTPGHCDGAICLYEEKNKLLFSGDTVFTGGAIPRTDLPTSSNENLKKSYEKLLALDIEKLLPGHGKISNDAKNEIENAYEKIRMLE